MCLVSEYSDNIVDTYHLVVTFDHFRSQGIQVTEIRFGVEFKNN